jgi:hypothetical protein
MEKRNKQDGIRSWCQVAQQYETDGNKSIRIKILKNVMNMPFIVNIEEELLNGSKTLKMFSQNWLYLGKRLGILMKSRSVALYKFQKSLFLLIQFLKN